jgi:hypothetical protein
MRSRGRLRPRDRKRGKGIATSRRSGRSLSGNAIVARWHSPAEPDRRLCAKRRGQRISGASASQQATGTAVCSIPPLPVGRHAGSQAVAAPPEAVISRRPIWAMLDVVQRDNVTAVEPRARNPRQRINVGPPARMPICAGGASREPGGAADAPPVPTLPSIRCLPCASRIASPSVRRVSGGPSPLSGARQPGGRALRCTFEPPATGGESLRGRERTSRACCHARGD